MINLNTQNKGTSAAITGGIVFFLLFFSVEFIFITYLGADAYIDAPEIEKPTAPEEPATDLWNAVVQAIVYPVSNLGYFFSLFLYGGSFGVLNAAIFLIFTVLVLMYIFQLVRGN